jgi:hypothetical protein
MVPFFRKKCDYKCAKYVSTQTSGESTRDASGQRAKTCDSGIAHASGRIQPFPLTALSISYSCKQNLSGYNSPKKEEETEQHEPLK